MYTHKKEALCMSDTLPEDVTSRRRTETWLRTFINTTRDAVVTIDRQERIVLFNPSAERIFGYTHAEVLGQKVHLLMPEPYASEHTHYIERYEQTGQRQASVRNSSSNTFSRRISPIRLWTCGESASETPGSLVSCRSRR